MSNRDGKSVSLTDEVEQTKECASCPRHRRDLSRCIGGASSVYDRRWGRVRRITEQSSQAALLSEASEINAEKSIRASPPAPVRPPPSRSIRDQNNNEHNNHGDGSGADAAHADTRHRRVRAAILSRREQLGRLGCIVGVTGVANVVVAARIPHLEHTCP